MAISDAMRSRGDDTRRRLLDAAMREFAMRGFGGASLTTIAREAAVSKPGLIHHFGTKENLLDAVMTELNNRAQLGISHEDLYESRGLAVFDTLDRLVEINSSRPRYVQLGHHIRIEGSSEGHMETDMGVRHFTQSRAIIVRALEAGIEDGEVRDDVDCDMVATQAVAMMEGLENQWLSEPRRIDMVATYKSYSAMLRTALRATPRRVV